MKHWRFRAANKLAVLQMRMKNINNRLSASDRDRLMDFLDGLDERQYLNVLAAMAE